MRYSVVVISILLIMCKGGKMVERDNNGCSKDEDCGEGYICNMGNCILLDKKISYNEKNCDEMWKDIDDDGYTDGQKAKICGESKGYKSKDKIKGEGDCNDGDKNINPETVWFKDKDGDGYGDGTTYIGCEPPEKFGWTYNKVKEGDCNDEDWFINPSQEEKCGNEIDENCNGYIGFIFFDDKDKDGYAGENSYCIEETTGGSTEGKIRSGEEKGKDCDDNNPQITNCR